MGPCALLYNVLDDFTNSLFFQCLSPKHATEFFPTEGKRPCWNNPHVGIKPYFWNPQVGEGGGWGGERGSVRVWGMERIGKGGKREEGRGREWRYIPLYDATYYLCITWATKM